MFFHGGRCIEGPAASKGGQAEGEPRGEAARDVSLYLDSMLVHASWKFEGSDAMCALVGEAGERVSELYRPTCTVGAGMARCYATGPVRCQ